MAKIFYFSGTGNSYIAAKRLGGDDIVDISAEPMGKSYSEDVIGFVFPCYCYDAPEIVKKFVKSGKFIADYIYTVVTCGASEGNSSATVGKLLKENGSELSAHFILVSPDNCIIFATEKKLAEKLIAEEAQKIKDIADAIENRLLIKANFSHSKALITKLSYFGMRKFFGLDKKKAGSDCIKCGLCEKLCPVSNIKSDTGGNPIFLDKCENCFRCIHTCPTGAISFGNIKVSEKTRFIREDDQGFMNR